MLTHNLHNAIIALYKKSVRLKGDIMYRRSGLSIIGIISVLPVRGLVEDGFMLQG